MKKKVLFCATVDYHFVKFHLPYLKWFKEEGWEVHVAASGGLELPYVDEKFSLPIVRSPFRQSNLQAYRELKAIMKQHHYSIIHCHTPMGGVLTRLAARKERKLGAHVLYTAHGFHFYKGAPLLHWLIYYPIEWLLSRYTDCLITINSEDYLLARTHPFRSKTVEYVPGVGVDLERFQPISEQTKQHLRAALGYKPGDFLLFYAAEFNKNKNQQLIIKALSLLKTDVPHARLLLAGEGSLREWCMEQAKVYGIAHKVEFLGYREHIEDYLKICDLAVASSFREGLPVNVMEAMACGLPLLASKNRGHNELIENGQNGFIVNPRDYQLFASRLLQLAHSVHLRRKMGKKSLESVQRFSIPSIRSRLIKIYSRYMQREAKVNEQNRREELG
ncbi:putative glycosyltransferase EpsD [Pullulanibacillus camelliae]|uniref:Putative glycosyltransferase EpsD n=1 Tax=Pullulanibacillus camelliae TaxID=1707096 RepID=A0A8J2VL79_9BACL|nr:glycosyltransferase family 4 protein [Pullulanibacillus camelliae]GGE30448.1 putative glycosyltransferase EpsD [Pullulanibacillus camelliae]